MGVAEVGAASISRFLARDLGHRVRVNLVAAGPSRSLAAKPHPGYEIFEDVLNNARRSDGTPATRTRSRRLVALLSDWFPATTGEIIHVDSSFHAIGA